MPIKDTRLLRVSAFAIGLWGWLPSSQAVGTPAGTPPAASHDGVSEGAEAAPPIVVEVQPSPRRARLFGRLTAGFVYRWALQQSFIGGSFEGELGARDHRFAAGGRLRVEAGKMLAGLPYQVITIGPSFWLPPLAERIHFGMGLEGGALLIDRRTVPGSAMWTVMWGGRVDAVLDLVRMGDSGAVYFATGVSAQALTTAPFPVTVATGFAIGYRP
ncbi:MAG TPA: hypothetical protein PLY80_05910 [Pseudomonadota bacterium]|nr:hypothetical protein [Pseudomonadota bacterium]